MPTTSTRTTGRRSGVPRQRSSAAASPISTRMRPALLEALAARVPPPGADELEQLRHRYLTTQVESLRARLADAAAANGSRSTPNRPRSTTPSRRRTRSKSFETCCGSSSRGCRALGLCSTAIKRSATGSRFRRTGCRPCSRPRSTAAARARSSTSRCRPTRASRSSTSRTRAGAATTGIKAITAA